jgi:hypothetical protein
MPLTICGRDQAIMEASGKDGKGGRCEFWRCMTMIGTAAFGGVNFMHSDGVWESRQRMVKFYRPTGTRYGDQWPWCGSVREAQLV